MTSSLRLSVVVPLFNEEECVAPLVEAVSGSLSGTGSWELVLVDDGSTDATPERAEAEVRRDGRVRLIRLARNYGQTAAMQAGFDAARGDVVVSMDGDLQNDPRDIPRLLEKMDEGYDLVTGYRENRQDRLLTRKVPSWVANHIIRWITGVRIRDNGCSLKAYRHSVLDRLHMYSDMHRFIPAVAAATSGARITEIPVRHHARQFGQSKYGLSRIGKVLADLLAIKMIRSFRLRPLVLFGWAALGSTALAGAFGAAWIVAIMSFAPPKAEALVLPGAALLWMGLAGYLLLLGLVAEAAVRARWRSVTARPPLLREEWLPS